MNKNFLISGFGRSGTKFLSSVMNMSNEWTVLHEPRGNEDVTRIQPTPSLINDFSQDYYGEVNSYLRYEFFNIPVEKRGLLLRNPKDIIKSASNRNTLERSIELVGEIHGWYNVFKQWIEDIGIYTIHFEDMTTNKEYLENVLKYFNINDVDLSKVDLNIKVNKNIREEYKTFQELPYQIKKEYEKYQWSTY